MPEQATAPRARRQTDPADLSLSLKQTSKDVAAHAGLEIVPKLVSDIQNDHEFSEWFREMEGGLRDSSYDVYQSCLGELTTSEFHLDALLSDTSSALEVFMTLSQRFKEVELQTSNFQKDCEGLLSEQTRGTELAESIRQNLQYYDYIDPASRRLNAPGAGSTVRGEEFSNMLRRLDECLDYMETHSEQKDAETYRARYRLLMTRGLTLIRGHFVSALREIYTSVSKKIANSQLNDTTMSALLYAKFRVGAPEMKRIGLEIQKRAVPPLDPDQGTEAEYQSLLNELHSNFSATRGKLILPLIRRKLNDIAQAQSTSTDLVIFARASITYIRGICLDEFSLWGEWFHGQRGLYDFLETICEPFYDDLRPRIIHETNIIKLCQLCTLLQTRYFLDNDEDLEHHDTPQLDFSVLIQPALEDVQTRLVFRAQAYLRDEIERYKPKPEDLAYPARNRNVSLLATSGRISRANLPKAEIPKSAFDVNGEVDSGLEQDSKYPLDSVAVLNGWYPTLKKAIWLLSRIYRLVNSAVFDDLAHQIVHQTTMSLLAASSLVSNRSSQADGQLFLMSHLLILKQQIVAFDIEFVAPEVSVDFSGITNTFWELRERGGLFNPRNLVRLVGHGLFPRVVENMLDAKVELDGRLRTVINDFVDGFATRMTESLASKVAGKWGREAGDAMVPTCQDIEKEVNNLRRVLNDSIDDARMRETLVGAVEDRVIQIYDDFFDAYTSSERSKGKLVSRKGKGREDAIWDVDTFADWCEETFRVGVAGLQSSDDDNHHDHDDDDDDAKDDVRSMTVGMSGTW